MSNGAFLRLASSGRRVAFVLLLCLAVASGGEGPELASAPKAERAGQGARVSFAVTQPTDVEVAILDAKGSIVRHLFARVLRAGALRQEIAWDGLADDGKPASGGPFRARVAVGTVPRLAGIAGWDGQSLGSRETVAGMAFGPGGELFLLLSSGWHGRSEVRVLDTSASPSAGRGRKYLRTIMPYPASLPKERSAAIGHLEVEGERLPIVFSGHGGNLHPLTSGIKKQRMVFSPKGHLVMASAVGTMAEHGPPRHLLALAPGGGAPEGMGFVGPLILPARAFIGGSGEGGSPFFDHLATSPDGEWIYLTMSGDSWAFNKFRRHAVFRLRWTDEQLGDPFLGKPEPGDDDAHFNDPQGIATDDQGNLYVADRGNNRVMLFAPEGKVLSKFAVQDPEQLAVHPDGRTLFVVARKPGKRVAETTLLKFALDGGAAKETARLETKTIELIALDASASPPRLWAAVSRGYEQPWAIVPVASDGGHLALGQPVTNSSGLGHPMFLAVDAARQRAYVTEMAGRQVLLDLRAPDAGNGRWKLAPYKRGIECALDREGNVYMMNGYKLFLERYDPEGKPLPFAALGTHKLGPLEGAVKGPDLGLRGHAIAPNGDIYILRMAFYSTGQVDVYSPDGKLKKEALVARVVHGSSGLGVDPAGNVYVGSNIKPAEGSPYPAWLAGKVPETGWVWWRQKRDVPWCYPYYNAYLYHLGCVLKFPPTGGEFFGGYSSHEEDEHKKQGITPPKPPEGTPRYKSGYLNADVWVKGALWRHAGYGPCPTSGLNWGDPSCTCFNARLAVDGYGRVFAPNPFRFSVEMLDTDGVPIARIGRYGNADSAGPGSKVPEPEIAFAWPAFTAFAGGKLYVSDSVNRRIVVVRLDHAATAECPIP